MSKKNCNSQKTSIFLITKCIMKSLVNGIHHTHNHELLHEIEQREGHDREIDAWLEDFFQ